MAKGKLYCVCKEAEDETCKNCEKGKRLKPDHIVTCPTWPRRVTLRLRGASLEQPEKPQRLSASISKRLLVLEEL